jgi:hypothetical protein
MSTCLHCRQPISADHGFYEVTHQPEGSRWRVCSLPCLIAFVKGGEDE